MGGCEHKVLCANCPHCLKIQNEYYAKIKSIDPEWQDIEDTRDPARPLKSWHGHMWITKMKRTSIFEKEQIENYYQRARELLHTHQFETELQRKIWELHSDGLSKKKIEKEIKHSTRAYKRESIGLIINRIAEEIK